MKPKGRRLMVEGVKVKVKVAQCVLLFATPWIVHGILQARILEWGAVAIYQEPKGVFWVL